MKISISQENLNELKDWFNNYVKTFHYSNPEIQQNINLKDAHTMRVCKEIVSIGEQLGLTENELRLAETIALFHDIGRFEQYARYKTFQDRNSENHAELGIKILKENNILEPFEKPIQEIILRAIQYHNRASLPPDETSTTLFCAKLIRDADKLDIWKVVTDYYYRENKIKNGAIELDLPDTPGYSEKVIQSLLNKEIVNMGHVKNLNDFKLLQVGWVFDINFQPTFNCIKEHRYLEMMRDVLPYSEQIDEVFNNIDEYLKLYPKLNIGLSPKVSFGLYSNL